MTEHEFDQAEIDPSARHNLHPGKPFIDHASMPGLDRITVLAAYRLLASGQLPDPLELAAVERFPVEPPDGSVLRYQKDFGSKRTYTYVALRAGDKWYRTGRDTYSVSWDELVEDIGDRPCWIATDWQEIPRPEPSPFEGMTPAEWHRQVYGQTVTIDPETKES